jgi:hypothetical protein
MQVTWDDLQQTAVREYNKVKSARLSSPACLIIKDLLYPWICPGCLEHGRDRQDE